MSEIWAVKIYFIEVKRPDGRMTEEQHEFMQAAIVAGAEYVLARSIDDVRERGL